MAITFEITFGKGEQARTTTIAIDPEDLPLGFNEDFQEAAATERWRDLNAVLAEFLGLTKEEVRQITNRQFKQMMLAIQEAAEVATAINPK